MRKKLKEAEKKFILGVYEIMSISEITRKLNEWRGEDEQISKCIVTKFLEDRGLETPYKKPKAKYRKNKRGRPRLYNK